MKSPVVRAEDLGYGHVKYTNGRDPSSSQILTESFPSLSPIAGVDVLSTVATRSRDTFQVPINSRIYEVGKDVAMNMSPKEEGAVLDKEFAFSEAYRARCYGALNYMLRGLPGREIDYLVLGLPLNTYFAKAKAVSELFTGRHTIDTHGTVVTVHNCVTFPQPLGSFVDYFGSNKNLSARQETLIVDTGFNTVDFFILVGQTPSEDRSFAVPRGVFHILQHAARAFLKARGVEMELAELIRHMDLSLSSGTDFRLFGKPVPLDEILEPGLSVATEVAQVIKNQIGGGATIANIVLSGGGARLYQKAMRDQFPNHNIVVLPNPGFANVRGFQVLGERIAASANRARVAA
jgi:plasmid segregation protein ParM